MSNFNKLITNKPVSLTEQEVANLSETLSAVRTAGGSGGSYGGDGIDIVITGNNTIALKAETHNKIWNNDYITETQFEQEISSYATKTYTDTTFQTKEDMSYYYDIADCEENFVDKDSLDEYKGEVNNEFLQINQSLVYKQDKLTFGYDNGAISSIDGHTIAGTGGVTGDYYSASNPSGFINSAQAEAQIIAKNYITSSVSELDNFYSKSQTSGADEIANAIKDFVTEYLLSATSGELETWVSTNYYDKTETSSKTEIESAFDNLPKYILNGDSNITATSAQDGNNIRWDLAVKAHPTVTDTTLTGEHGIYTHPTHNSGEWCIDIVQSAYAAINDVHNKLDITAAAQTYQPSGDYATNTLVQNTSAAITALIPSTAGLASEIDLQIVSAGVDVISGELQNYLEVTAYDADSGKFALKSEIPIVPTKVSDLTDSANYYKTTETSGATELTTEFAKYQTKGNYITSSDLVDSAKSATFAENLTDGTDTSSFSEITASIDWCNTVADHYQTNSGEFVTSSNAVITGTKQYALTSAGWVEVQAGGLSIPVNVGSGNALNISTAESGTWGNNADGYLVIGHRSKAGNVSFVFGNDSIAQNNSTVLNGGNSALHDSIAQGWKNIAIERSQAFGYNSSASNNSLAAGYSVVATDYSFAGGQAYNSTRGNILANDHSFALGVGSNNEPVIANKYSFAFGYATSAQNFAFAFGKAIDVEGSDGHAVIGVGGYNEKVPSAAIIVGNGTNNVRHNAFVVYNDGNVSSKNYKAEGYTDSNNNYVEASVPKSIPNSGDNALKVQKMFVCTSDADIVAHAALANGEGCVFFRVG